MFIVADLVSLNLTHQYFDTRAHTRTHAIVKRSIGGPRPCKVDRRHILGFSIYLKRLILQLRTFFEFFYFLFFLVWFCCFTSQVNSYGHCGTVSSPNHTFSWAGLNKRLTSNSCTYFRL